MIFLTVSKTRRGKNCFPTLSEALASLVPDGAEPATIMLEAGEYREKVTVSRPYVTLCGSSPQDTVLSFGDYAYQTMGDGSRRGTFRSYTLFLDSHDITLENLTVRNTAAPRSRVGQAIALYADGDRIMVNNCRLEGFQDTLFTGPLPPTPLLPGGFTGPKEFAERIAGRQYYKNCYICGDIDFIFGSAAAYFENCEIASVFSGIPGPDDGGHPNVCGYVAAASTPKGHPYGYVFHKCRFTGNCPAESVYLGRPWRNFARTVLIDCFLGGHIRREGFDDWDKPEAHDTVFYAEYRSAGPGASPGARAPFVRQLTDREAEDYRKDTVLSGPDGWDP